MTSRPEDAGLRVGTVRDVAELLRVTERTVYQLVADRRIPTLRRIGPHIRFDLDAVEHWLREGGTAAGHGVDAKP